MNRLFAFLVVLLGLFFASKADFGSCRYDEDRCSCKIGEANQGICWDKITGSPGECSRRFCRAGWTCACGGRTHVCYRANRPRNTLKNDADVSKSVADCVITEFPLVVGREITLGTLRFHFSRPGILSNDCAQVAWWHNGELLGNRKTVSNMSSATIDQELKAREEHSLLELRPGDLIAFRFKESSYYCYKHLTELVVNTTAVRSDEAGFITHYAREFSLDWFLPTFVLTAQNTGEDESEQDKKKFIPLRTKKQSSNTILNNGTDYWEPRDDSNADNKRSNWYFRIQIPNTLPVPSV